MQANWFEYLFSSNEFGSIKLKHQRSHLKSKHFSRPILTIRAHLTMQKNELYIHFTSLVVSNAGTRFSRRKTLGAMSPGLPHTHTAAGVTTPSSRMLIFVYLFMLSANDANTSPIVPCRPGVHSEQLGNSYANKLYSCGGRRTNTLHIPNAGQQQNAIRSADVSRLENGLKICGENSLCACALGRPGKHARSVKREGGDIYAKQRDSAPKRHHETGCW